MVGLTQEGEGEDGQVEEKAENVKYAEAGDQSNERRFETKICLTNDTESDKITLKRIKLTSFTFTDME